jgi:GPH family glycoside/pentoside/hexuronide:cation symporter
MVESESERIGRLGTAEKLSYVTGEFGATVAWNLVTGFLVYYYTDVALLPIGAVGTLMLLTRMLDAVFDPIAGTVVDRTQSRFGRTRPYFLLFPIPLGVLLILTFSVPAWSDQGKIAWAFITFMLFGLVYSFLHVPFGALQAMITRDNRDKVDLASFRAAATSIGSIFVYAATLPTVQLLGGSGSQRGFSIAAACAALIMILSFIPVFMKCHERYVVYNAISTSAGNRLNLGWMRNPLWLIASVFGFLMFVRIGILAADTAYFAKNVMADVAFASILLPILSVAVLTGGLLSKPLIGRYGLKRSNILALVLSALAFSALPLAVGTPALFFAGFLLGNIAIGINSATFYLLIVDAVALQQKREGVSREGLLSSSATFCIKVGMATGGAIVAYTLSLDGYHPDIVGSSKDVIAQLFYFSSVIVAFIQIIVIAFYSDFTTPDAVDG